MEFKIAIVINTAKNRLRYFDTTFNSVYNTIPFNTPLYVMADIPSNILIDYISTNKEIKLNSQEDLYPNNIKDWQDIVGFIQNKKSVQGIQGKHTKYYINQTLHIYENINYVCRDIISNSNCDYLVYIEDDVIFKQDWFNIVLNILKELEFNKIGYLSLFNYKHANTKVLKSFKHFTTVSGTLPAVCVLLNTRFFLQSIPESYEYNIERDFLSLTSVQLSIKDRSLKVNTLPTEKRSSIYNRAQDSWLIKNLSNISNIALINKGVCQHIGVISSIYESKMLPTEHTPLFARSIFNNENKFQRVDRTIAPPFVL